MDGYFYDEPFGVCDQPGCGKPATHTIRHSIGAVRYRNSCPRHVQAQLAQLRKAHR